jgi:hypothetical protein
LNFVYSYRTCFRVDTLYLLLWHARFFTVRVIGCPNQGFSWFPQSLHVSAGVVPWVTTAFFRIITTHHSWSSSSCNLSSSSSSLTSRIKPSGIFRNVRFQVLTAASMKFRFVFWGVLPGTPLWNVGRQLFYTAVHPRRQIWIFRIHRMSWSNG